MYLNVLGQENVINNSEHNIIDSFMYHIIECAHCTLRYIQYQYFQRCHNGITDTLQSLGRFYKYVQGLLVLLFLIRLPGRGTWRSLTVNILYIYIVREMNDMMMWETPSKTLLRLMMIMSARLWFVCSARGRLEPGPRRAESLARWCPAQQNSCVELGFEVE